MYRDSAKILTTVGLLLGWLGNTVTKYYAAPVHKREHSVIDLHQTGGGLLLSWIWAIGEWSEHVMLTGAVIWLSKVITSGAMRVLGWLPRVNVESLPGYMKLLGDLEEGSLHDAVEARHWHRVKVMDGGRRLRLRDQRGQAPLHRVYVLFQNPLSEVDIGSVMRLIKDDPDVMDLQDEQGYTLLHLALSHEDWGLADELIQAGADIHCVILDQSEDLQSSLSVLELIELKRGCVPLRTAIALTDEVTLMGKLTVVLNLAFHAMNNPSDGVEYLKHALKYLRPKDLRIHTVMVTEYKDLSSVLSLSLINSDEHLETCDIRDCNRQQIVSELLIKAGCQRPVKIVSAASKNIGGLNSQQWNNSNDSVLDIWRLHMFEPNTLGNMCIAVIRNEVSSLSQSKLDQLYLPKTLLSAVCLKEEACFT